VLYRIGDERETEDIVQDTVMTIAQKYKELTAASNFSAWAYSILENNLRNFFRTQKYNRDKLSRFAESGHATVSSTDNPELKARLRDCLHQICHTNLRYARMLNLYYQGYTTVEICKKLGINPNHAYVIFSRAKSMLKKCLREKRD